VTEPQFMSWDVFNDNQPAITADVWTILAAKGKNRRRFRLDAVYEKATSVLVAEVLQTTCGPVVVMTDAEHGGASEHMDDIRRRGRDIAPLTGDPSEQFVIRAKSRSYVVMGAHFNSRAYPGDLLVFRR
jgi:hypothetical protein